MADRLGIIWAASRSASAAEQRLISEIEGAARAVISTVEMSSLGREVVAALVQGPVIVVVSSRKDAATALSLGADEIVRVTKSVLLRKSTLGSAIERAEARAQARSAMAPTHAATEECPGLALLMRILERGLGGPPDAAMRCNELAEELARVVAIADRLMQRVQVKTPRDELKGWFNEVRDYARATLKAEALTSALQEEVQRTGAVVKMLGDLSIGAAQSETDLAHFMQQLADLLRADIAPDITIEVVTDEPCVVQAPRQTLIGVVCAAVEIALDTVLAGTRIGHIRLRATKTSSAVVLEVADDGALGATDLRASIADPFFTSSRTTRLRQVRGRARSVGGELIADGDETGNIVSIYFPVSHATAAAALSEEAERRPAHGSQ